MTEQVSMREQGSMMELVMSEQGSLKKWVSKREQGSIKEWVL